ncbi:TIGR02678 family protein [Paenibacillus sp. LHD-38]|uniref:TIGR02678 family protein n=1 Tax=Paenibacillus sp. LHD-38 TaxID=3072143 RepID=UPI0028105F1F|nr:TIGR02678 family protein [Paenibacillus sp. LHD-38]MDQ8735041.1 TIGR02678 family protein [Paenibacillus sp. LHD-38]
MATGALRRASKRKKNEEQVAERKRAGMHALLNRPWITKEEDPDIYYTIKDHYEELRGWFMDKAGFPLIMTRTLAKLDKTPVKASPWMGFAEFREKQDYIFFTYSLWYLEGKTEFDQFLLSDIVEEVREQMLSAGLDADWRIYSHRLSMTRALKKLRALGVLHSVDGDETSWAQDAEKNVLYECSPASRYVLRRFPRDLTECNRLEELEDPIPYAETQDGQSMRRRHRVYRRLLLEPVMTDQAWDEEDLQYVLWQRRAIIDQMEKTFGFVGRRYREGLLFFHPELTSESELFPTMSAGSDLAMLLAGELRKQLSDTAMTSSKLYTEENGTIRVTKAEMETMLYRLQQKHKEYWSKEMRESASQELAVLCMEHLAEWGLGQWESDSTFLVSPVLARWNAEYGNAEFD